MGRVKGSPTWAKYKNKKRLSRKYVNYVPNQSYLRLRPPLDDSERDNLIAPENFSILSNRGPVIEYVHRVLENIKSRKYSIMNMHDIQHTDLATIAIVISMMMDRRNNEAKMRKYINVHIPMAGTEPGDLFRQAQFHQTVTGQGIADHTFFLSRRSTKVNVDFIDDVLKYADKFLGQDSTDQLSPIMVEIMQNTNNHANPDNILDDMNIPWFLAVIEDNDTGKMIFSLVDLGIGIFESLKRKNLADTSQLFDSAITDLYDNSQSKFLRTNIPKGVDSSTGLSYRGKGLQTVYTLANRGRYDTFKIVTNRALVNILDANEGVIDSADSFGGTVYYWEMSKNG